MRFFYIPFLRSTQVLFFGLLMIAVTLRSRWMWIVVGCVGAVMLSCLIVVSAVGLCRVRKAWRDYPNTPECEEYERRQREDDKRSNKNRIELK